VATVVLLHGSFHGGWCWDDVAEGLRKRGHAAIAPTLPGLEADFADDPRKIDLSVHIAFVDRLIDEAGRADVVAVGHSYAGFILPAVSAGCRGAVFVDAFLPRRGETAFELLGPLGAELRAQAEGRPDFTIPPPPPQAFGLSGGKARRVAARLRPMPAATHSQASEADALGDGAAPRAFIRSGRFDGFAEAERRAAEAGWRVHTLPVGHDSMILAPRRLAKLIAGFARRL